MTAHIEQFRSTGYCVLNNFIDTKAIATLKLAAAAIIDKADPTQAATFATQAEPSSSQEYFLESAREVRCFFEPAALDADGALRVPQQQAVNKLGHGLHDSHPTFSAFSRTAALARLVQELGVVSPQLWQSMYILKAPRVGSEVSWHQDATFFYTQPQSVLSLWFALDDAHRDNGCLWVDKAGPATPLRERFYIRDGNTQTERLDSTPWPDLSNAEPIEVSAGALVCFTGTLPHYSAPNLSAEARHAYTLHITDAQATYHPENWIQSSAEKPIRGF
ncbi:MAG: phytanoyl-CoA dioxygenase family protein [Pseudomonadota bacterium]